MWGNERNPRKRSLFEVVNNPFLLYEYRDLRAVEW